MPKIELRPGSYQLPAEYSLGVPKASVRGMLRQSVDQSQVTELAKTLGFESVQGVQPSGWNVMAREGQVPNYISSDSRVYSRLALSEFPKDQGTNWGQVILRQSTQPFEDADFNQDLQRFEDGALKDFARQSVLGRVRGRMTGRVMALGVTPLALLGALQPNTQTVVEVTGGLFAATVAAASTAMYVESRRDNAIKRQFAPEVLSQYATGVNAHNALMDENTRRIDATFLNTLFLAVNKGDMTDEQFTRLCAQLPNRFWHQQKAHAVELVMHNKPIDLRAEIQPLVSIAHTIQEAQAY